ncbi:hypothetical protein [Clostridium manihotivorum]|uniref:Uncharacterized protein n=1 Tax=Clostridium manihotivorum TaxID=2320868 RepID=A0A410DUF8_9CLOT|nr:hypothetical protein [Clostridium manihotivorum]QAA32726.1 hypothetical protein C1I91_14380 [Clostridium manihotivorum]
MNKQQSINLAEYKYISSLLAQLLEVDIYTEEIITGYIENFGVDKFFNNIEIMDLPSEVIDKLENLQLILEALEKEKEINNLWGNGGVR